MEPPLGLGDSPTGFPRKSPFFFNGPLPVVKGFNKKIVPKRAKRKAKKIIPILLKGFNREIVPKKNGSEKGKEKPKIELPCLLS